MTASKRILAVISDRDLYQNLEPLLQRATIEFNHVVDGRSALMFTGNLRYDLIIIQHPLKDLSLRDFLTRLRDRHSPSAAAPALLLAPDGKVEQVRSQFPARLIHTASLSAVTFELQRAVSKILGVAIRAATRLLVQIEVQLEGGKVLRACQTKNVSGTGVLVRTARMVPIGSLVRVAFNLPGDPHTIRTQAEVVRHTVTDLEDIQGMGLRFIDITSRNAERIEEYVQRRLDRIQPRPPLPAVDPEPDGDADSLAAG